MMTLCIVTFYMGSRQKFFYFIGALTLDKGLSNTMKLIYKDPRPYMLKSSIGLDCSSVYGMPSGHSSSAVILSTVLILDFFHGERFCIHEIHGLADRNKKLKVYNWCSYLVGCLAALIWATCIPFSRYLLGAHSLDQVLFGALLGLWEGLFMHFIVREKLLLHIGEVVRPKRSYIYN